MRARLAIAAVTAATVLLGAEGASTWRVSSAASPAGATAAKPPLHKKLIPYTKQRKRDMAAYSKRHYGHYKWQLVDPKLVVMHYAEAGSIGSIYNTFAPNHPDPEFHETPNVCSHFGISARGGIYKFVPVSVRCRHVVGLNHVAIGIEHVGFSDGDVLNRQAQLNASLQLTQWLRCRFGLPIEQVIGHNESLSSPFYKELDPRFKGQTHGDFNKASMDVYRGKLQNLGPC
jgi:N-acetylmuramoyl-L-alanine amidase